MNIPKMAAAEKARNKVENHPPTGAAVVGAGRGRGRGAMSTRLEYVGAGFDGTPEAEFAIAARGSDGAVYSMRLSPMDAKHLIGRLRAYSATVYAATVPEPVRSALDPAMEGFV